MKRIEVDDEVYGRFQKFQNGADESKVLDKLVTYGRQRRRRDDEQIALVILEGVWYDFSTNPGHASNAPFLEGVCRFVDTMNSYRLNFYDATSFAKALEWAVTVPEKRIILYIGEHGSTKKIGNSHALTLMKKVAEMSRDYSKIEGVILSSCLVGSHDDALEAGLKGGAHWVFGYTSSVDFIGSAQVESSILATIARSGSDYVDDEHQIAALFAEGLKRFNPDWMIGDGAKPELRNSVRLVVRGKHKKTACEATKVMTQLAW